MKNAVYEGHNVPYTNSGAAIASGAVVGPFGTGDRFGVAISAIADGTGTPQLGQIQLDGVFELDATSADVWADGDSLYWDPATDKLTDVAGSLKVCGVAVGAKLATVTTAKVKLKGD